MWALIRTRRLKRVGPAVREKPRVDKVYWETRVESLELQIDTLERQLVDALRENARLKLALETLLGDRSRPRMSAEEHDRLEREFGLPLKRPR